MFNQIEEICFPFFLTLQDGSVERFFGENTQAYREYLEFRNCFMRYAGDKNIERALTEVIKVNPNNAWGYLGLGRCYWYRGEPKLAAEMFDKAVQAGPQNGFIRFGIAACYFSTEERNKTEQILQEVIKINPGNALGYAGLGICAYKKGRDFEAEELFQKAFKMDPFNALAYFWLGNCYMDRKEYGKAEEAIKKSIELDPHNAMAYFDLAQTYWLQKKYDKAGEIIEKATVMCAKNDRIFGMARRYYEEQGDCASAEKHARQARALRLCYYNPVTRYNYQRVEEILAARRIRLVCVQYPLRSVEQLKRMFDSTDGVIFVDNEKVFKDALLRGKYEDYFRDAFAGDFGHCTPEGNRLLAENVAKAIIKECFNKHE